MKIENKSNVKISFTTSGDTINKTTYSSAETYTPGTVVFDCVTATHSVTRYGRAEEKNKIYSQATRKHDELFSINEKLKNLAKHI